MRNNSEYLDSVLGAETKVLDHGFIRVVDYMGNEASIVQSARVSYGEGTKTVKDDVALLRYLMKHWHTSPFEMCEIKLHVKLPIFIARQWIRHRTANVNEVSARYSVLPGEFYTPERDRILAQSTENKQGSGESFDKISKGQVRSKIETNNRECRVLYEDFITMDYARESARMVLPLNTYTEWYWKVDLHNLLHFLRLRADSHAQWEIQQYALVILDIVKGWMPNVYQAFLDYRLNAKTLSAQQWVAVKQLVMYTRRSAGDLAHTMSKRELDELNVWLA